MLAGIGNAKIDLATCVGIWLFDEGKGDTAMDSSSNGNDGTLMGAPEWVAGQFGKALEFDAAGDYVDCGSGIQLANKSFSWSFWLQRHTVGGDQLIIGQGVGAQHQGLVIGFRGSNVLTFAFWSNDLDTLSTHTDKDWHHWAGTYNATDKSRNIYFDGTEIRSGTASANYQGSGILCLAGGCGGWAAGRFFNGIIDEVAMFNIVLTDKDVQTIMEDGLEQATGMKPVALDATLTTTWADLKK
jgi:hypothetical protein